MTAIWRSVIDPSLVVELTLALAKTGADSHHDGWQGMLLRQNDHTTLCGGLMKKSLIALFLAAVLVQPISAQSLIVPGGSQVGGWGVGGIQTVGQTFTALNSQLNGFSFWLKNEVGPPITFIAYVFKWDDAGFRATGPALYVSPMSVSPPPPPLPGFTPYSFATTTALTTGGRYVAFLSVVGFNGLFASVESSATDVYSGGTFVFTSRPPMLFSWDTFTGFGSPPARDLRFEANFSPVPEPSSMLLTALGLAGLRVVTRRRRQHVTTWRAQPLG